MVAREHIGAESQRPEPAFLTAGVLHGASCVLLVTGVIGGAALLLDVVWPWLAWGYVSLALAFGIVLALVAGGSQRAHEREVEEVRRRCRSE